MSEICPPEIHRIECLPAEMCMRFGKFQPDKFHAVLFRYGDGFPTGKLPVTVQNECEICISIPERYAKCGAGRYYIQIMDGCQECDKIDIELVAECYVSEVSITEALPKPEHCNGCI